ncbi:hypothetical protein BJX70DRAFT_87676 [Aspergillus crustosus]
MIPWMDGRIPFALHMYIFMTMFIDCMAWLDRFYRYSWTSQLIFSDHFPYSKPGRVPISMARQRPAVTRL